MAALALIEEGFDVALPSFKQPSFDMISKWGSALHTIQVKTGCLAPNCKTVQWKTTKHASGLYSADDCSYFGLVLIPRNSIWWLPFSQFEANIRSAPILSTIYWLNTEETLKASKSANETANGNAGFKKSL